MKEGCLQNAGLKFSILKFKGQIHVYIKNQYKSSEFVIGKVHALKRGSFLEEKVWDRKSENLDFTSSSITSLLPIY